MSSESLPILPTSVIGSYAYPGWLLTALEKIGQGEYGETDIREVYDDACRMAILDQERGRHRHSVGWGDASVVLRTELSEEDDGARG